MNLKILLPAEVFVQAAVGKVVAQGGNGSFCLLPNHIDFVASLVPGILSYTTEEGKDVHMALGEGTLVKCAEQVLVSTRSAVTGPDLGMLKQAVEEAFRVQDEREKIARAAAAKLEADIVRRFVELKEHG
jgi:F-type H+-transporting ATPase subunit epsilon